MFILCTQLQRQLWSSVRVVSRTQNKPIRYLLLLPADENGKEEEEEKEKAKEIGHRVVKRFVSCLFPFAAFA